ncbi:hypothetical protein KDX40_20360 [Burkholderia ambifaria]|uniref:hypothetical protein n=1 Tax=Burkholderia ambifaria TaxID=152480 RepID=UPI001B9D88B0|nr:hypothetical protein [Burkholderia ambifaria]MBR8346085.1 hypothetical protein [Burkholderia ambifaria]
MKLFDNHDASRWLASYPTLPSDVIQMCAPCALKSVLTDSARTVSCVSNAVCSSETVVSVPESSE